MVQCAELGDISGPLHSRGGANRHAYCLPFRNHHFSRINSTSHSTAGRVRYLYRVWGIVVCVCGCMELQPRQVQATHAVKVNDRMLRQTLCDSLAPRCSFWRRPEGGCRLQVVEAVAVSVLMKLCTGSTVQNFMFWLVFNQTHKCATRQIKSTHLLLMSVLMSAILNSLTVTEVEH